MIPPKNGYKKSTPLLEMLLLTVTDNILLLFLKINIWQIIYIFSDTYPPDFYIRYHD